MATELKDWASELKTPPFDFGQLVSMLAPLAGDPQWGPMINTILAQSQVDLQNWNNTVEKIGVLSQSGATGPTMQNMMNGILQAKAAMLQRFQSAEQFIAPYLQQKAMQNQAIQEQGREFDITQKLRELEASRGYEGQQAQQKLAQQQHALAESGQAGTLGLGQSQQALAAKEQEQASAARQAQQALAQKQQEDLVNFQQKMLEFEKQKQQDAYRQTAQGQGMASIGQQLSKPFEMFGASQGAQQGRGGQQGGFSSQGQGSSGGGSQGGGTGQGMSSPVGIFTKGWQEETSPSGMSTVLSNPYGRMQQQYNDIAMQISRAGYTPQEDKGMITGMTSPSGWSTSLRPGPGFGNWSGASTYVPTSVPQNTQYRTFQDMNPSSYGGSFYSPPQPSGSPSAPFQGSYGSYEGLSGSQPTSFFDTGLWL